jgi:hypothetical protein
MNLRAIASGNFDKIAVGSTLASRKRVWTVIDTERRNTSVGLLLRCGERQMWVTVPWCITGPDLHSAGLRSVQLGGQREIFK